ncbi:MAG: asparagine synthase C-terminal domain-containing protein, partial [Candidatus Hodarchaeota archaeon]
GPDELFAGYSRHVSIYESEGEIALEKQLWNEYSVTHEANIERDERAIASTKLEAVFPFLQGRFVETALSIPCRMKVNPPRRKIIFRELGKHFDIPEKITARPKKATQHSSGSTKLLVDALCSNVEEAKNLSKKHASNLVQPVLDQIAFTQGLPVKEPSKMFHFDIAAG